MNIGVNQFCFPMSYDVAAVSRRRSVWASTASRYALRRRTAPGPAAA